MSTVLDPRTGQPLTAQPPGAPTQVLPVHITNPPVVIDPFQSILYAAFLRKEVWLEWYGFDVEWNTLAASATGAVATVTIDPGIDFILQRWNMVAYTAADTIEVNPDYVVEVRERSGNSNLSDTTIHVANTFGGTRQGVTGKLDFPRYIRGNNTLQVNLTNRGTTAAVVNLELFGIRVTYTGVERTELFGVPF
jgi:hypothetical protein